jgi:hypothetical protein
MSAESFDHGISLWAGQPRILDKLRRAWDSPSLGDERRAFVVGWLLANSIVAARFLEAAIDAVPLFNPEHGWDRIVLTRRFACGHLAEDPSGPLGTILLRGDDTPQFQVKGAELDLGTLVREDPRLALEHALSLVPVPSLPPGDHSACWHERATLYPVLYGAVTELIIEHAEFYAAREVFVDDQHVDGTFHPLFLHGIVTNPTFVYDWFSIETADRLAFFRINGDQALVQTETGAWRAVGPILQRGTYEALTSQLRAWLRLS